MIGKFGETLVVDWGLAKVLGRPEGEPAGEEVTLWPSSRDELETVAGTVVGTPAYMSPEQAAGRLDLLRPASDIYSLGATLYALLTGQAPIRGEDQGELLRRASRGDWVPPRQVNNGVPAALDAICRKAMALNPQDRYATAQALAVDVEHWLADEPVTAYREPLRLRARRWARRHPALVAASAAGVLVALLAAGAGAWWLDRQRAERRQAVEATLSEAGRLQAQSRWGEARAVLDQAAHQLGDGGPGDLRARLERRRRALKLVVRLDAVRLKRAGVGVGRGFDFRAAARDYEEAFRAAGMVAVGGETAVAASWVRDSGAPDALVAALDDWAACAGERERRSWLLGVARRVDPDPWRDRARDPAVWNDAAALVRLAAEAQAEKQPPQLLAVLGLVIAALGADAEPLLRGVRERLPGDFWVNYQLGIVLAKGKKTDDAVGYLRAAQALRPRTAAVHQALGNVLHRQGKREEAASEFRKALDLDPTYALAHNGLGNVLRDQGKLGEAAAEFLRAIDLDPRLTAPHHGLGNVLHKQGKLRAAAAEFRRAIELDPRFAFAHHGLGNVFQDQGKLGEAAAEFRRAIDLDPEYAKPHHGLGTVLYLQRKLGEAAAEFRRAIELDPKFALPYHGLGNVLRDGGQLDEAAAAFRKALDLDPNYAQAHNGLGNVLRAQGKLGEATATYRRAIDLKPDLPEVHCNLGHALGKQGRFADAVAAFRRGHELGSKTPRWAYPSADWIREAERLRELDDRLTAVLKGEARPADAREQLALAQLCRQYKRLYAAAARLYDAVFAGELGPSGDLQAGYRYHAARAAALAAAGQGEDAAHLDAAERARLRGQALAWLRADLRVRAERVERGTPPERAEAAKILRHWRADPDFAGVRGPAALGKLPEAERAEWQRLWADVQALLEKAGGKGTDGK
jgi:tetratricopeptide (TPR) repeat protein